MGRAGWINHSVAQESKGEVLMKDACYKKVKASYDVFPSARASQAIAKCRKGSGSVRKSDEGTSLKRWQAEKWVDTKSGKACGAGGKNEYCRPTKRVSAQTPKTKSEISPSKLASKKAEKSRVGMGSRVS
jgi:hypothetical protein